MYPRHLRQWAALRKSKKEERLPAAPLLSCLLQQRERYILSTMNACAGPPLAHKEAQP
jgi:hypothetical protein